MGDIDETPPQPGDRGYHSPIRKKVTDEDLHDMCRDVRQIKKALIGENPFNPSPDSLVSQHADMRRTINGIRKVAWAGVLGAGGLLIHKLGMIIFGVHP